MSKFQAGKVAYEVIRSSIIRGQFKAGERLKEAEIATMTGVSRTPVREALRRLAAEGFVQIRPGSGAVVNRWTRSEAAELFEIRAALEALGAGVAAQRAGPEGISRLEALCDRMESAARTGGVDFLEKFSILNTEFHATILEMSGNAQLTEMASSLMKLGVIMRTYSRFEAGRLERSMMDHRSLVSAMRHGSFARAEATMRSHILASIDLFEDESLKED